VRDRGLPESHCDGGHAKLGANDARWVVIVARGQHLRVKVTQRHARATQQDVPAILVLQRQPHAQPCELHTRHGTAFNLWASRQDVTLRHYP
jgi:hypothetical protein